MNEWEWEKHWRFVGMPEIGDYIQVRCESLSIYEGIVTHIKGHDFWMSGSKIEPGEIVEAWRKRILPIKTKYEKQKETENVE